jgi:hypothetical protein
MLQTTTPSEHQALGRQAKGFSRPKWDERKSTLPPVPFPISFPIPRKTPLNDFHRQILHRRTRQLPQIHQRRKGQRVDGGEIACYGGSGTCRSKSPPRYSSFYLETLVSTDVLFARSHAETFQASPTDRIWGVGFGREDALENRSRWGENRLGEAIMRVRERLRGEREEGRN